MTVYGSSDLVLAENCIIYAHKWTYLSTKIALKLILWSAPLTFSDVEEVYIGNIYFPSLTNSEFVTISLLDREYRF